MKPEQLNTIVSFLEDIKDNMQDGETISAVIIDYAELCKALEATGKYDNCGYKLALEVTEQDKREKYGVDNEIEEQEFVNESKEFEL